MPISLFNDKVENVFDGGLRVRVAPKYSITRGEDHTLQWEPPIRSRELANALSYHYPLEQGLQEMMQRAILDFLDSEVLEGNPPPKGIKANSKSPVAAQSQKLGSITDGTGLVLPSSAEKAATQPQSSQSPEVFEVWDIKTGESVKPKGRKRGLSPTTRQRVAENRGNTCAYHRKAKTQCDPKQCRGNKLYPGTAVESKSANGSDQRKRDRNDEWPTQESSVSNGTIVMEISYDDHPLKRVKESLPLSPSLSKSVNQLVDAQTPLSSQDCYTSSSKPILEEENANMSLNPFAVANDLIDHNSLYSNFKSIEDNLTGNIQGSFPSFQRSSEAEKLFPSLYSADINLDLDPSTMGQFSIEDNIVLQGDWPAASKTFGTESFDWIEDLMASDLPSLEYDWPREEIGTTATLTGLSSSPSTLYDCGLTMDDPAVDKFQSSSDSGISSQYTGFSNRFSGFSYASRSSSGSPLGAQASTVAPLKDANFGSLLSPSFAASTGGWSHRCFDVEQLMDTPNLSTLREEQNEYLAQEGEDWVELSVPEGRSQDEVQELQPISAKPHDIAVTKMPPLRSRRARLSASTRGSPKPGAGSGYLHIQSLDFAEARSAGSTSLLSGADLEETQRPQVPYIISSTDLCAPVSQKMESSPIPGTLFSRASAGFPMLSRSATARPHSHLLLHQKEGTAAESSLSQPEEPGELSTRARKSGRRSQVMSLAEISKPLPKFQGPYSTPQQSILSPSTHFHHWQPPLVSSSPLPPQDNLSTNPPTPVANLKDKEMDETPPKEHVERHAKDDFIQNNVSTTAHFPPEIGPEKTLTLHDSHEMLQEVRSSAQSKTDSREDSGDLPYAMISATAHSSQSLADSHDVGPDPYSEKAAYEKIGTGANETRIRKSSRRLTYSSPSPASAGIHQVPIAIVTVRATRGRSARLVPDVPDLVDGLSSEIHEKVTQAGSAGSAAHVVFGSTVDSSLHSSPGKLYGHLHTPASTTYDNDSTITKPASPDDLSLERRAPENLAGPSLIGDLTQWAYENPGEERFSVVDCRATQEILSTPSSRGSSPRVVENVMKGQVHARRRNRNILTMLVQKPVDAVKALWEKMSKIKI